jgi:hypothetical protein
VTRSSSDAIEAAIVPLDRARVRLLRALMPLSGRLAGTRELRVAVLGLAIVSVALLTTMLAPLWMLALGPIVLGVPHLLADLRYCVVRPGWHRERALWLTAGIPLVALGFGAPLELGFVGVAASTLALSGRVEPRQRSMRLRLVVGAALGLAAITHALGSTADLIFAHAHNFIAVAMWALWRRRESQLHALVLASFVLASACLMLGIGDLAWTSTFASSLPAGLDANTHVASLAPELSHSWALRLVLLYAFAQAVHYGVWLRLVPEDDRPRVTPRSFRASYRALRDELGVLLLAGFALASIGLAVWACVDLVEARTGYLRFARFHGMLELTAISLWVTRRRRT